MKFRIVLLVSFCLFWLSNSVFADTLRVNGQQILIRTKLRENELRPNETDTLREFLLIKPTGDSLISEQAIYVFSADCNNTFIDKGTYVVIGDSLVLYTLFTQTGHDPIMRLRKQVFILRSGGMIEAFSDEYFR